VRLPRPCFQLENILEVTEKALLPVDKKAAGQAVAFRLETHGLQGNGRLYIDSGLVQGALGHVLENSLEAFDSPKPKAKKKTIEVSLSDNGQDVQISIVDQGRGFPKDTFPSSSTHFFLPGRRVGLGLTFARRVMGNMEGRMGVKANRARAPGDLVVSKGSKTTDSQKNGWPRRRQKEKSLNLQGIACGCERARPSVNSSPEMEGSVFLVLISALDRPYINRTNEKDPTWTRFGKRNA